MKEKICENCRYFIEEGADGKGWCTHQSWITLRNKTCKCFERGQNGWEEITTDNEAEVYNLEYERVVIAYTINNQTFYELLEGMPITISTMAKFGGYYYYVFPELKIE